MSPLVETGERRRRGPLLTVVAVLVVALLALVLIRQVRKSEGDASPSPVPSTSVAAPVTTSQTEVPGPTSTQAAVTAAGGYVAPVRMVTLPPASRRVSEYPVGFPQTPEGAAAAAVAAQQAATSLDYVTAQKAFTTYLSTADRPQAAAVSVLVVDGERHQLGVASSQGDPGGAGIAMNTVGVQWQAAGADIIVSILASYTFRRADGSSETRLQTWIGRMVWDDGDWKLRLDPTLQSRRPAVTTIGTNAFNDSGWSAVITPGAP